MIIIQVLIKDNIKGGEFSIDFCDWSKKMYEENYFSEEAPSYRTACKGINIFGKCIYRKCPEAYNKEVIIPLGNKNHFNLINEREILLCPVCEAPVIPKTVGFHLCEYKIKGKKFENEKYQSFELNGKADNKDSIQYFNPDINGETMFGELIIEISKYL